MGVNKLWTVLDAVKKEHNNGDSTLFDQTLAIDLSIWMHQSSAVYAGYKSHLR